MKGILGTIATGLLVILGLGGLGGSEGTVAAVAVRGAVTAAERYSLHSSGGQIGINAAGRYIAGTLIKP